jgi:sugar phosphate isomerase/epimerase
VGGRARAAQVTSPALVLSHFTVRHATFTERVQIAADNGFAGIGLYLREYERLRATGRSDAELRDVLDRYGQRIIEFEAVQNWATTGTAYEVCLHQLETVERMADAFGAPHHVQVVGPFEGDLGDAAAGFRRLCDRLGERGIAAAIEYLPRMTNIPDAATALRIVEATGRDNGGLCVDSWHHFRSAEGFDALAQVPAERVVGVQFSDGPPEQLDPDYKTDCMTYRRVPGDGDFDLVGFVRTLDDMGVDVPYAVEVISDELDELPAAEAVRRIADGTRAVLSRARTSG